MPENPDLISAGYLVARRAPRPEPDRAVGAPDRIVSASERIAPILPSMPLGWFEAAAAPPGPFSAYANEVQGKILWALAADLERFGLASDMAMPLADHLSAALERGDFFAPSGFVSVRAACEFMCATGEVPNDAMILGLALTQADAERIADSVDRGSFLSALPRWGRSPEPGGRVLGYEVLAPEDGELVSWVENEHGPGPAVSVNPSGLIASPDDARRLAEWLSTADPGRCWAAWRIATHEGCSALRRAPDAAA